jgi:hypothetical protein
MSTPRVERISHTSVSLHVLLKEFSILTNCDQKLGSHSCVLTGILYRTVAIKASEHFKTKLAFLIEMRVLHLQQSRFNVDCTLPSNQVTTKVSSYGS